MYLKKFSFYSVVPYVINFYILARIIFADHGIFDMLHKKKQLIQDERQLQQLIKSNNVMEIKLGLINEEKVDLRYLEELVRLKYSMIQSDEKVILEY